MSGRPNSWLSQGFVENLTMSLFKHWNLNRLRGNTAHQRRLQVVFTKIDREKACVSFWSLREPQCPLGPQIQPPWRTAQAQLGVFSCTKDFFWKSWVKKNTGTQKERKLNLAPVWEGADLDKSAGRRGQGLHCQIGGGAPGKVKKVRSFPFIWVLLRMFTWWTIGEGFFYNGDNDWFCLLFVDNRSTYPGCRIPKHRWEHHQGKDICHWGTSGCSAPTSRGFPRHCHRCPPPSSCPPPPPQGPRCRTCCALWGAAGQQCLGLHFPDRYRL